MTKMALTLSPRVDVADAATRSASAQVTGSGFPGESAGLLNDSSHWRKIEQATISYGYGLSVTPLQLAHAYATLGAGGISRPVTLRRVDAAGAGRARHRRARRARTAGDDGKRRVAGRHRQARGADRLSRRRQDRHGVDSRRRRLRHRDAQYMATFGGVVPASHPRLAAIVVIDEPGGTQYYGGDVAAPVFANVMAGALRLLGVPPDGLDRVAGDDARAGESRAMRAAAAIQAKHDATTLRQHTHRRICERCSRGRACRRACRTSRSRISRSTVAACVRAAHSSRCRERARTASASPLKR